MYYIFINYISMVKHPVVQQLCLAYQVVFDANIFKSDQRYLTKQANNLV